MQQRETFEPRSPLEALLARTDAAAADYIADELVAGGELSNPPLPGPPAAVERHISAAG
jgi:hypothetical protein